MPIRDTWKYGSLYVDAALTIDILEERGALSDAQREMLAEFRESDYDFTFDSDWHGMDHQYGMYSDPEQLPLILIGTFGGYPGQALDDANAEAAKEWAEDREYIYSYSTRVGGCEMVWLYFDLSAATADLGAAEESEGLAAMYAEYPCLDEDLWSEKSHQVWDEMIEEMIDDAKRDCEMEWDRELSEDECDLIRAEAGEFYGHWDEGYFPEEEWNKIILRVVNGEVQLHQEDELPIIFTGGEMPIFEPRRDAALPWNTGTITPEPTNYSECGCSNPYCQA